MAEIFTVEQRGVGKPDYSREVSSALERRGIKLAYRQTLKVFGLVFSAVNTGTHTAVVSATVMTDAAAYFVAVNALRGLTIFNVTDGSSGTVTANTINTVTVAALAGGATNQWNPGDAYTIPSPYSWVAPALAPGASAHFIDNTTGIAMPFTIPQGYIMFLIAGGEALNEDVMMWGFLDGFLAVTMGVISGGTPHYENKIVGLSTETVDPTGASAHTVDITLTNQGAGNLQGGIDVIGILEAVGTPELPTTKTVRCKFCEHEEVVPRETVQWICPKCGQLNIFYDLSRFRGTR